MNESVTYRGSETFGTNATKSHRSQMLPHRLLDNNATRLATCLSFESSFPRTPPPSPSKHGGRVTSKTPSVGRSKPVSVKNLNPGNSIATSHDATGLPTPRSSLDSLHNSQRLPPSLASDPTNRTAISPSTPHPLVESTNETHNLSFDQVLSKLKPLLDGKAGIAGERKISIEGISSEIVHMLREKSRASELPGWENIRYVEFL